MARATLSIDLGAVVGNWRALAAMAPGAQAAAVVKADAYGLGIGPVGRALARAGVQSFFVAQVDEALPLRKAIGFGPGIWVFAGYTKDDAPAFSAADAMPLLNSLEQVAAFKADCGPAACGLQVNSGMNRLGLNAPDLRSEALGAVQPNMVISHLACADVPEHPQNAEQLKQFIDITASLTQTRHSLAATGGTLLGPDYHFDMIRPGIGVFGGLPFAGAQPVVSLDLPVLQVLDIPEGQAVGYGATWTAPRPSRIATLSAGYADGLIRAMGGHGQVFADAVACPMVGRVSMDLLTIDVTGLKTVPDTMTLLGPQQGIDDVAAAAGTIGYEILTGLGDRYERVYKGA